MQTCFYHAKSEAAAQCQGCKMPICQACQEDGDRGFCGNCHKKVSSFAEQVNDAKATGHLNPSHKITTIKTAGRPTSQRNVTYCFHHFDVVAAGTCPTCSRPFCPACLDSAGVCSHCVDHPLPAQERVVGVGDQSPFPPTAGRVEKMAKPWTTKDYVLVCLIVVMALILWKLL